MKSRIPLLLAMLASAAPAAPALAQGRPAAVMPAFSSDSALMAFLRDLIARRDRGPQRHLAYEDAAGAPGAAQGMAFSAEAITNTQHAGVDEGDIVKLHGDFLIILRRGRLFTVAVGGNALRPASMSDAYGRGVDPGDTWYDEMLVFGDKVVVIGYSYARGGTEAGIFRLDPDGTLHHTATFQLRSNDYYSSRNYAARLVGSRLVFYAPLYLPSSSSEIRDMLPAFRRWHRQQGTDGFVPIVRPEHAYRPAGWRGGGEVALHTVTSCQLDAPEVSCEASVVVGPPGNVFYVSPRAVYVWMTSWSQAGHPTSFLTRMPLDGTAPSSVRVTGSPVDQFSFLESEDGYINILTRAGSAGDAMWDGEDVTGPASLLRLPIDSLGDGGRRAAAWWYRPLPTPGTGTFQNRFVGDFLLYGTGSGWGSQEPSDGVLYAIPWRGGDPVAVRLAHGTDRIEVMGAGAVVVGARGSDLEFTGISLRGRPAVRQRYTLRQASQGELRSHGFFYRADGADSGVLGLPVGEEGRPGYAHLIEGSAAVLYLKDAGGRFALLGRLVSGAPRSEDDDCRASCMDWYGNARPIFARGRVFALLGYEIVEGQVRDGVLREWRRASFQPRPALARAVP